MYKDKKKSYWSTAALNWNFNIQKRKYLSLELGKKNTPNVIVRKGLAEMNASTLRSLMLLDQVGDWVRNKLQRKLAKIIGATKRHGPLATDENG